jgi:SWI/SNF-related matrix-associated actin-dependent regulator of chromatin subfamily A-like protein 1
MMQLYRYQQHGRDRLLASDRCYLAWDMGLGKTATTLSALAQIEGPHLVVAPAGVTMVWAAEARHWAPERVVTRIKSGKDRIPADVDILVISYDMMVRRAADLQRSWSTVVFDEAHYLKGSRTKRVAVALGKSCRRRGGLIERARRVWCLSGTPMPNNPSELWPLWAGVFGDKYVPEWEWNREFCRMRQVSWGNGEQIVGGQNLDRLRTIWQPQMSRLRKEKVLTDLPPIRWGQLPLDPGDIEAQLKGLPGLHDVALAAQAEIARRADDDADLGQELLAALAHVSAEHMATLRRMTSAAKVPALLDTLGAELELGGLKKVIVFAHHRNTIEELAIGLGEYYPVVVHGGIGQDARARAVEAFQTDPEVRVFIGQITAAGTGITLTAAADVVFAEMSWVPGENAQAAARAHRIGQKDSVLVRCATLAGSIDEAITITLARKAREISTVIEVDQNAA